jgi:hypothetical protein
LLILRGFVESQLLLQPTNTDLLLLLLQTHMVSPIGFDGWIPIKQVCYSFLYCRIALQGMKAYTGGGGFLQSGSGVIISDWIISLVKSRGMLPPFAFWIHYCFCFRRIILLRLINCSKTEL